MKRLLRATDSKEISADDDDAAHEVIKVIEREELANGINGRFRILGFEPEYRYAGMGSGRVSECTGGFRTPVLIESVHRFRGFRTPRRRAA